MLTYLTVLRQLFSELKERFLPAAETGKKIPQGYCFRKVYMLLYKYTGKVSFAEKDVLRN